MGSKYVGEGSYGCVVYPMTPCIAKNPDPRIAKSNAGKIYAFNDHYEKEADKFKIIQKIDPNEDYFIYSRKDNSCKVDFAAIPRECGNVQYNHKQFGQQEFKQAWMSYGGSRIDMYVKAQMRRGTPINPYNFLLSLMPTLMGIELLASKGYCHQDIKSGNVLIHPTALITRIIDYSVMIPLDRVYQIENFKRLKYSYSAYPPEYKLFMKPADPYRSVRSNIFNRNEARGELYLKLYPEKTLHAHVDRIIKWLAKPNTILDETHAALVDVYSAGMMMLDLSRYLEPINTRGPFYKQFMALIKLMIHPDPRKRARPEEMVQEAKNILSRHKN